MQSRDISKRYDESVGSNFWRRQFRKESTSEQRVFDSIFGIIVPLFCAVADPAIFKGSLIGDAFLGAYKPFAYILGLASVVALGIWLSIGRRSRLLSCLFSGLFLAGAIFSLAVGIILIPLSVVGLAIGIGVLGFAPFLSAFVYARNTVRIYHSANFHAPV